MYKQQNSYAGNKLADNSIKLYNKFIKEIISNLTDHLGDYSAGAGTSRSYSLGFKPDIFKKYQLNFGCN